MNSRNGVSKEFRFRIVDKTTGEERNLTFSFKHQALEEWTREKWIKHSFDDGSEEQEFLWLFYYFRIDWTELIVGDDADLLQDLRNSEYRGDAIYITPHIDIPGREFKVATLKSDSGDSEEIRFEQTINHRNSQGNKGTVMIYKTTEPASSWEIVDPSKQQGVSTIGMEEFA